MGLKLYESKEWLHIKYNVQKMTPAEIAKACGASERTVYQKLKDFGFLKSGRR